VSPSDASRSALPIPERARVGLTTFDAKDPATAYPPIVPLRPPAGAPNVLVVNRFHTTALCSPTRQALLTGRNHHAVGMGAITDVATSAPGYSSMRPDSAAPLAETMRLNGYSTAQIGKCHVLIGLRRDEAVEVLTEDLADKAITWIGQQKSLMPDKPFLMYFAPGGDACAPPRAQGVQRQVQGSLRRGLGRDP
jgi:arylsulfatase A-like enzyme